MNLQNNLLNYIEILINKASLQFIKEKTDTADTETVSAGISFNVSKSILYTTAAFKVYSMFKDNVEMSANNIAEQIIKLTAPDEKFHLNAENGYINIYINDFALKTELNRITADNIKYSENPEQSYAGVSKEAFPVWYCINKISTSVKYLWNGDNCEDPLRNIKSRNLSLYLLYIDYKNNVTDEDLLLFSKQFYEYDRSRSGPLIPYDLYLPILQTLQRLSGKINK